MLLLALLLPHKVKDILAVITDSVAGGHNVVAFLDAVAAAEGCGTTSTDGYNVLAGGSCFTSFADHPKILNRRLNSTAAGRYQFIFPTWDGLRKTLNLPDFSPLSQDKAAIELIRQCGALQDVEDGHIQKAIGKCRRVWASFPGSDALYPNGTPQPKRAMQFMLDAYTKAGGTISPDFSNVKSGVTTV